MSTKRKLKKIQNKNENIFLQYDRESYDATVKNNFRRCLSETSFVNQISKVIRTNSRVYIGNSMPIRHWDMFATHENKNLLIEASRGMNGIDGQLSTFLGFACESAPENWGIFGDLTVLYDFAGIWMLKQRPNLNVNFVVMNNFGGKIFSRVLSGQEGEFCQNCHELDFKYFAKMWRLSYKKITNPAQLKKLNLKTSSLIEIIPESVSQI